MIVTTQVLQFQLPIQYREHLFLPGVGCADIEPPENAYVEREDDKVIIGCVTSTEKVTLD